MLIPWSKITNLSTENELWSDLKRFRGIYTWSVHDPTSYICQLESVRFGHHWINYDNDADVLLISDLYDLVQVCLRRDSSMCPTALSEWCSPATSPPSSWRTTRSSAHTPSGTCARSHLRYGCLMKCTHERCNITRSQEYSPGHCYVQSRPVLNVFAGADHSVEVSRPAGAGSNSQCGPQLPQHPPEKRDPAGLACLALALPRPAQPEPDSRLSGPALSGSLAKHFQHGCSQVCPHQRSR